MAEKKSVLGTILAIGAVAAAGTAAYLKRNELKKAADDIMKKFKAGEEGVYGYDRDEDGEIDVVVADTDGNGEFDTMLMDNDGDGEVDEIAVDTDGDGEMDVVTPLCEESDFAE